MAAGKNLQFSGILCDGVESVKIIESNRNAYDEYAIYGLCYQVIICYLLLDQTIISEKGVHHMRGLVLTAALILAINNAGIVVAEELKKECTYFKDVRENMSARKNFMAHFNYAMSLPLMLYGDYKRKSDHLYKPYVAQGKTFTLDRMTIGCLECHGKTLVVDSDRMGADVLERGFHGVLGQHAIGLNYHEMVLSRPGSFRKPDPKRNNIIFVGGKLGCVSCHNPYSTLPFHLNVLEKDQALCKECHVR